MKILKNKILAPYTTFGIGGTADYFCQAKTTKEIAGAIKWAGEHHLPYFILGGGSNILIGDKGFRGLIVKCQMSNVKCQGSKIIAGAGLPLANLLQFSVNHSLSGLEFLTGVPGTVGGAVVGNAGTKKGAIAQAIEKVTVLREDGLIYNLNNKECRFDYRSSRFKKSKEIILEAVFRLRKEKPALIRKKIDSVLKERKNQPSGKSGGCIFRNSRLHSAGFLIDRAGLKGTRIGDAVVSKKHANWIINRGDSKAADVVKLIRLIKEKVKKKFDIQLKEEICLVGEF